MARKKFSINKYFFDVKVKFDLDSVLLDEWHGQMDDIGEIETSVKQQKYEESVYELQKWLKENPEVDDIPSELIDNYDDSRNEYKMQIIKDFFTVLDEDND